MDFILFLTFAGAASALGIWLGMRVVRRKDPDARPAIRKTTLVLIGVMTALGLVAAWAIVNGHAAIGIGILVAVYVVPNLIEIPIRIRQSNRRAREARARRQGSPPHSSAP